MQDANPVDELRAGLVSPNGRVLTRARMCILQSRLSSPSDYVAPFPMLVRRVIVRRELGEKGVEGMLEDAWRGATTAEKGWVGALKRLNVSGVGGRSWLY
eukprot:CAMPEP_0184711216 /NCGR_PEP_ID=MMETSP0314-20130426/1900_1 /TAXON_ID=38298 /ORGANISM="Rhodella maculata, Strain CCMP 736" /LENGTH=99 /DNA_ID=CAMNT_0027173263 /DNA_START=275 /DNA_END=572 /DNA_ORIENTATION=+